MYDRTYAGSVLSFEPSGALMNAALVMRDRETDSWWSIMTGDAVGGPMEGTPLREHPSAQKMRWREWKRLHPETKIISIEGREHVLEDPYSKYFASPQGFRGMTSGDGRLADKEPVFVFKLGGQAYAVPHDRLEGGAVFNVGDREIFLYRKPGEPFYASTAAFESKMEGTTHRFVQRNGKWRDAATDLAFVVEKGFARTGKRPAVGDREDEPPARLSGFDTFWYIWSRTYEDVILLE